MSDDRGRPGRPRRAAGGERGRAGKAAKRREPGGAPRSDRARAPKGAGGFGPYRKREADERAGRGGRQRRDPSGAEPRKQAGRASLRVVGRRPTAEPKQARRATARAPARRRRRRGGPDDVRQEIARLAGRDAPRAYSRLMQAADAFGHDREREALRLLRPVRERLADSPSVRELVGLAHYRLGNYAAASKELEAFVELTDSVEQHPVLMDAYRAQRRWRRVEECWRDLAAASPSAALVAEGRIVYAGALTDQGRLAEALTVLQKRADPVRQPREHHLRLWYALADLEERAGNLARARELFDRVRRAEPSFADVAERRAVLG